MTTAEITTLLKAQKETLLADLAIHFLRDIEEVQALVEPMIFSGQVKQIWRSRKTTGRKLCGCDNEVYLQWVKD